MFNLSSLTKYSLAAVAILAPAALSAQTAGPQSVTVNATVTPYTTLSAPSGAINIGNVNVGSTGTVSAATGATVTATFNTSTVTFSIPNTVTLSRSGGGGSITASLSCAIQEASATSPTACPAAVSNVFSAQASYATSNGVAGTTLASAQFFMGASVTTAAAERAGNYSGTFSVTLANSGT